jgi:GNAT superfamily N-acetyltransferase
MSLSSPSGTPITVRPIERGELDRVVLRCWPERDVLERLFQEQGTIGMAAWEGDKCVGTLHCYRIAPPDWRNEHWPEWNRWWTGPSSFSEAEIRTYLERLSGSLWCHACYHVGRMLELQSAGDEPDHSYFGRGIGTALCRASTEWARGHGYAGVLVSSAAEGLFRHAVWSGSLPWTTYARLGFEVLGRKEEGAGLPGWAQGDSPPEVMAEVRDALAAGRSPHEFHGRLMVLDLKRER